MKKIWLFIMMFLCTGCLMTIASTIFTQKENKVQREVSEEVIRFHVRANSDAMEDQQVKIQVKNAVVKYLEPIVKKGKTIEDARTVIREELLKIRQVAEKELKKNNIEAAVSVQLKNEYFPEKTYGAYTFPKGNYEAVVISLGKGIGKNWWCMLYPGLCFVNESYGVVSEEGEEQLESVLSEDAFRWISLPDQRKCTFRWLFLNK